MTPSSREPSTLPGRSAAATGARAEPTPSAQETRAARLMIGVMLASAGALAFTGAVFLQLVIASISQATPTVAGPAPECREGDSMGCLAGHTCQDGNCIPVAKIDTCQVGDSCDVDGASCNCVGPLHCEAQVCRADKKPASCEDPAVQRVLRGVFETCKGSWDSCPDDKLEDFALASEDFEGVLAAFPDTLTVHFPGGLPPIDSDKAPWPDTEVREHYQTQLARPAVAKALREAQVLLLIGRSSQGGHEPDNRRYSRKRVDLVVDWILKSAASGPAESTELRGKLKRLLLGSRKVLAPDFFLKHYANRIVAWDTEAENNLRSKIANLPRLRFKDRRSTLNTMNQVVFIVPIPCQLPGEPGK